MGILGWETSYMNARIAYYGMRWRKGVRLWFNVGAVVGLSSLFITLLYLLPSYIITQFTTPIQQQTVQVKLIIPGVTIPVAYFGHVMIAIFVTLAFHELGHGLAGANEEQSIDMIGVMLQIFLPTAYVRFSPNLKLSPWAQVKVCCAGAWHNFVLYLVCSLILQCGGVLVSPLYREPSSGLPISHLKFHQEYSPLLPHDRVIGLNEFDIHQYEDWSNALTGFANSNFSHTKSVCYPNDLFKSDNLDCCEEAYQGNIPCWIETKTEGPRRLCKPTSEVWPINKDIDNNNNNNNNNNIDNKDNINIDNIDNNKDKVYCSDGAVWYGGDHSCPKQFHTCIKPYIKPSYREHGIMLLQMRVQRMDNNGEMVEKQATVLQNPLELLQQVQFFSFEPRWSWIPSFMAGWADTFILLIGLLVNFNAVAGLMTLLPIVAFDGEHALEGLLLLLLPSLGFPSGSLRTKIIDTIKYTTTGLCGMLFVYSMIVVFI